MPSPSARRPLARVLVAVLALAATGCSQGGTPSAPEPTPTPIANLNTSAMQIPRIDFCTLVPDAAVKDALGAEPSSKAAYGNGDSEPTTGVRDQALHEVGCTWTAEDGTTARAWVFARPVDSRVAATVIRATGTQRGCTVGAGPAFGDPTVTQTCTFPTHMARTRHAGLFGQTWLTCEVVGPARAAANEVSSRADAWCVEVAESLNTAR